MSLYAVQKLIYELNRSPALQTSYKTNPQAIWAEYSFDEEELQAFKDGDVGKLYILGVNGQLLMHFAAMCGLEWPEYIQAMRDALAEHGNVRSGIYATIDGKGAI
jgi:hypothetical protein